MADLVFDLSGMGDDLDLFEAEEAQSLSEPRSSLLERYSERTLAKSLSVRVEPSGTSLRAFRAWPESGGPYTVRPTRDAETGEVLGCGCTCPNGRHRARAACYHAAAVERWLEEHS